MTLPTDRKYWVFANNRAGTYEDSDWDMTTILANHRYYFSRDERNRSKVAVGDVAFLRIYGDAHIGRCTVGNWKDDPESEKKYQIPCGSFEMLDLELWRRPVPQALIIRDLSNQDLRSRLISVTRDDAIAIEATRRTHERLGFGSADGEIFILEAGIEEAIKPNLPRLGLSLANQTIQQQFSMGPGVGRSDLICEDKNGGLVVIEIKRGMTSDQALGQLLRYIGYVKENVAQSGQSVSGWIIAGDYDEHLRLAASAANIRVLIVRLGLG